MKNYLLCLLVVSSLFTACKSDDEETHDHDPDASVDYSATIMSPDTENKQLDEEIHIHAVWESKTKQTVHHVKVRIYNKADNTTVVYEKPEEAHVHEKEGKYELHDDVKLSEENGFSSNSDWVIEAKAWGHEKGENEVVKIMEFHID